eukprot:4037641-Amphidinium_carterae.1
MRSRHGKQDPDCIWRWRGLLPRRWRASATMGAMDEASYCTLFARGSGPFAFEAAADTRSLASALLQVPPNKPPFTVVLRRCSLSKHSSSQPSPGIQSASGKPAYEACGVSGEQKVCCL